MCGSASPGTVPSWPVLMRLRPSALERPRRASAPSRAEGSLASHELHFETVALEPRPADFASHEAVGQQERAPVGTDRDEQLLLGTAEPHVVTLSERDVH